MAVSRIPQEEYYTDAPITGRLSSTFDQVFPTRPGLLIIILVISLAGAVRVGWLLREFSGMPYDYYQLAWLIPLVTFLVAWGNRREG
jgi:hypothetical protein